MDAMTNLTTIILVASPFLISLTWIFVGGWLIRADVAQPGCLRQPSRLRRDMRPLADLLVDFFAQSKTTSAVLSLLDTHGKPVGYKTLVERIRAGNKRDSNCEDFSTTDLQAILLILQVARLIGMNRRGFSITDSGCETHRRINQLGQAA